MALPLGPIGGEKQGRFNHKEIPINCKRDRRGVWYDNEGHLHKASNRLCDEYVVKKGTKSIIKHAFRNCQRLTKIVLPDSLERIEEGAFRDCISLAEVVFPSNLKYIGPYAFIGCRALTNLKFPKGLKVIESNAFTFCRGLKKVEWPERLEYLSRYAFCTGGPFEKKYKKLDENGYCIHGGALIAIDKIMVAESITEAFFPNEVSFVNLEIFDSDKVKIIEIPSHVEYCAGFFPDSTEEIRFKSKVQFDSIFQFYGDKLKRVYVPKGTIEYFEKKFGSRVHPEYIEE